MTHGSASGISARGMVSEMSNRYRSREELARVSNQKLVWETIIISNGRCPQKCFPSVAALRDGLQLLFGKRTNIFIFCHRLLLIARAVLLLTVWHFQVPATSYLPAYTQSAEHKKRVSRYLCVSQ